MEHAFRKEEFGMILAHKIALDPNNVQETYFRKAAGIARFSYKWGSGTMEAAIQPTVGGNSHAYLIAWG